VASYRGRWPPVHATPFSYSPHSHPSRTVQRQARVLVRPDPLGVGVNHKIKAWSQNVQLGLEPSTTRASKGNDKAGHVIDFLDNGG
jgi:hypothetical protein